MGSPGVFDSHFISTMMARTFLLVSWVSNHGLTDVLWTIFYLGWMFCIFPGMIFTGVYLHEFRWVFTFTVCAAV